MYIRTYVYTRMVLVAIVIVFDGMEKGLKWVMTVFFCSIFAVR